MYISVNQLKTLLREKYGIDPTGIENAPRGFVAKTYYVTDTSNTKYFVKVIDAAGRYKGNVEDSLHVLAAMNQKGIKSINYPIKTLDEKLSYTDDKVLIVVFNFIDGVWTFDYDKIELLEILKSIHNLNFSELGMCVKTEDFAINFESELNQNLKKLSVDKELQQELGIDDNYLKTLEDDFKFFKDIIQKCQSTQFRNVITHGDAPGNVLRNSKGELFIIDWDDLLLAPIERDLWFHISDPELKIVYPDFKVSNLAYSFYVMRRYFDDLSGFLDEIYKPGATEETRKKNIEDIKEDIFKWLNPLVEKARDINLG